MSDLTVSMYGGLGNQLFQYAAARALSLKHSCPLVVDLSWFESVQSSTSTTPRKFALAPFNLPIQFINQGTKSYSKIISKLMNNIGFNKINKIFNENGFNYNPTLLDTNLPIHINGYWQSYKYFEHISETIRSDINTVRQLSPASQKILDQIRTTDAVCVHIRRGDYITNHAAAQTHGLCDMSYYSNGIEVAIENLNNPHCFVFSDDPEWVVENFKCSCDFTAVNANGPETAHEDLWLMSACKNFVIANSSLSWWGAWLNNNPNKIVIAPKVWFKKSDIDTSDLIPSDWIRL